MKRVYITGTAGFIGFHLAKEMLSHGFLVQGFDGFTDYYDVKLKRDRNAILLENKNFSSTEGLLEDKENLLLEVEKFKPDIIVHLAAQAGVRYSLENPRAYIDSNIIGSFNVMEVASECNVKHLMMASTSSVYGANKDMPFTELDKADSQLTIYAATKKSNESMAHAHSHLWHLPITIFRFFTVYGPWGRPDLALFKFVDAIIKGNKIDIYNNGEMYRDFTYVDDLVKSIRLLVDQAPVMPKGEEKVKDGDSLSPVAPFRVVNIGNSDKVKLLDFVDAIEDELGIKAKRNYMEMQKGDVLATWSDTALLEKLTGYSPNTNYKIGISHFVNWFKDYYT